jgi:hypothetical protein
VSATATGRSIISTGFTEVKLLSSRPPSRDPRVSACAHRDAGKFMREALLVAFVRRASQQPAFVAMGPGSRPGRRFVYDALARHKSHKLKFQSAAVRRHSFAISPNAFFARYSFISRPPNRGRRECRAPDAPAVSCAMVVVERTRAYRSHRNHPALPAQWFYGLYRVLPGAPGVLATVAPERLSLPRNLTPASGCQDHTILPYASGALVSRTLRVHRSPPRERDDRVSPLLVGRDGENLRLIWVRPQALFLKIGNGPCGELTRRARARAVGWSIPMEVVVRTAVFE